MTRSIARFVIAAALFISATSGASADGAKRLCVLVPHFKDEYWLSVGYGLETEAAKSGTRLTFFEAGGYNARQSQIDQLSACAADGADAILIGTVTSDHPDLLAAIAKTAKDRPVFGLVNALASPDLAGWIGVDWANMGHAVGRYLADRHSAGTAQKTAILISGPKEAGWTGPLEHGLRADLSQSSVDILAVYGADTGLREQLRLVEDARRDWPDVDYLIGSAPAIEAAMGQFAQPGQQNTATPKLVATYITHTIKRGLSSGQVLAAPFDDPMEQGRMALRQALAVLAGARPPQNGGPEIQLIQAQSGPLAKVTLSPAEYFPVIE